MNNIPGVAILGCGLIGQKRAKSLNGARLRVCADVEVDRAKQLAGSYPDVVSTTDWRSAVQRADVDIVIIATTNQALVEASLEAVNAGKHILVEKPAARNVKELDTVINAVQKNDVLARVGFNHRYHPALLKAHELLDAGELGELMFIRGRYGHGGRIGYEREWRADPALSGGGELIDQGVHLIDLSRWFMGDFVFTEGYAHTYFWDMPPVDSLPASKTQPADLQTGAGSPSGLPQSQTP